MKTSNNTKTRGPTSWFALGIALLLTSVPGRVLGQTARAQFVHASPDPTAAVVDVYFDDVLKVDDFEYKTATAFVDVPAGSEIVVTIAEANSSSSLDSIRTFSVQFDEGAAYHVVVVGVLDPGQYPPNPDGLDTAFRLRVLNGARETMAQPQGGVYDVRLFNAVPDAPSVDFVGKISGYPPEKIFSDIAYGSVSSYGGGVTNPAATGTFLGDLGEGTDQILLQVTVNTTSLSAQVNLLVFFGLLDDPSGLRSIGFFEDGAKLEGEIDTRVSNEPIEPPGTFRLLGSYPNPFNPSTTIRYELAEPAHITLTVHDALGKEVARLVDGRQPAGAHAVRWNTGAGVPSGVYFVTLSTGERTSTRAAVLLR